MGTAAAPVVTMPSAEWFTQQDASYREEVRPHAIRARIFGVTAQQADLSAWASLARAEHRSKPNHSKGWKS
jgi:transketolase